MQRTINIQKRTDDMKSGQALLVETLRDVLLLSEHNPCNASDSTLRTLANGLRVFLTSELSMDLSREKAARFLGMSTRNLGRKVKDGTVPRPERRGHKAISFSALTLAKIVRRLKD